jgi:hypothetical protein
LFVQTRVAEAIRRHRQAVFSSSATAHETRIAFQSGQSWPYFKWPYQAKVMKTFDKTSRRMVLMGLDSEIVYRVSGSQAVDQSARRRLGQDSGDSADGESDSHALLVPPISREVDREEWSDSGLDVGEEKIQPVQTAERSGGRRFGIPFFHASGFLPPSFRSRRRSSASLALSCPPWNESKRGPPTAGEWFLGNGAGTAIP